MNLCPNCLRALGASLTLTGCLLPDYDGGTMSPGGNSSLGGATGKASESRATGGAAGMPQASTSGVSGGTRPLGGSTYATFGGALGLGGTSSAGGQVALGGTAAFGGSLGFGGNESGGA